MNRGLYRRLASQNIKNNKNTFLPFLLSCIAMTAMFYMLHSIQAQTNSTQFYGAATMSSILNFGVYICGIFSVFVLFYTNSFLMKRRTKEFGLYSILGLEKKHIGKVVFWEIAIVGAGSITAGILCGMLFSRLMFMVLLKILHLQTDFTFQIEPKSLIITALLFVGVFLLTMLFNTIRVHRLKPIELMTTSHVGEREPKAKWILAILGILCLSIGYYLAVSVQNPIEAITVFFIAVLFVIAGTYLVFLSGSIALLKLLKKKKRYYYHKKHFITVSGMMYRMKQNATGLANICILSTAVLVVLSSTVSLYAGMEDVLRGRFPKDVSMSFGYEKDRDGEEISGHYDYSVLEPVLQERAQEYGVTIDEIERYYSYSRAGTWKDGRFTDEFDGMSAITYLQVMTLEDYNRITGGTYSLSDGEILLYATKDRYVPGEKVRIMDQELTVAWKIDELPGMEDSTVFDNNFGSICIVVRDMNAMIAIRDSFDAAMDDGSHTVILYNFDFDLKGAFDDKEAFCTGLREVILNTGIAHTTVVEDIFTNRQDFYGLYGSLLFIGIFIGTLFLITTVMIIYYKQISEGYEDRERFEILQKVGMSNTEVKGVIRNQILLVFFLPILLALVHICFAMDIVKKILMILNLLNSSLFVICLVITAAVFLIVYGIVYSLTARTYYHITNRKNEL